MKLFLIVLSLCPIIQICYSVECKSLPPELYRLSHGFDITSFDMFPPDLTQPNGFAESLFNFTCGKQKKWQNPYVPTLVYDLPDQIESITKLPGVITDTKIEIHKSYLEDKKAKCLKLNLDFLNGMFSLSRSSNKSMEQIDADGKVLTTVYAHISGIEVEMIPYWSQTASTNLKKFVDQSLPNTYLENPGKYQEFLSTFGTHYFTNARFGGFMSVVIETDLNYASKMTQKFLESQALISFIDKLSLSGGHSKSSTSVDDDYESNSTVTDYYYGGNANLIKTGSDGFHKWSESAQRMPWIYDGKVRSIVDFLPDGPKRTELEAAIKIKLDYAYLDELLHSLTLVKQNHHINVETANSYINQVIAIRNEVSPSHDKVKQLGASIEQFVAKANANTHPEKPICKTTYDKKHKKDVCVDPTTCICNIH